MRFMNKGAKGNVLLDLVLVAPIALLLLFVGIDSGLTYIERSAVYDSLRAGLNAEALISKKVQLYSYGAGKRFEIDSEELEFAANEVAKEIASNISHAVRPITNDGIAQVGIEVSALLLNVDPESGKINLNDEFEVLTTARIPDNGVDDPHLNIAGYSYRSAKEFISAQIEADSANSASRFAVPLGISYDAENPDSPSQRYLEKALVLYAEVRTITAGVNQNYVKRVLGRFYALQEQQIRSLRVQL